MIWWWSKFNIVWGHSVKSKPICNIDLLILFAYVIGFLSLDTNEVPGNAAMFDQIEGLRWVNKFVKYFGGDPNKVTLMGQSAGAASVSFLMLAPQARGT